MHPRLRSLLPLLVAGVLVLPAARGAQVPVDVRAQGSGPGPGLRLHHRTRFEDRKGGLGRYDGFFLRTEAGFRLQRSRWFVEAELIDSRVLGARAGAPLNTTLVNAVEPVQALVGVRLPGPGTRGPRLRLGLQTIDLGSRRLVARNRWRNTTNAFLGAHLDVPGPHGHRTTAFAVSPVQRRPDDRPGLDEADPVPDRGSTERLFLGIAHAFGSWPVDAYLLRLDEGDSGGSRTRDRRLWTLGARLLRGPALRMPDWELEGAVQWGRSRATTDPADTRDLDHRAGFLHAHAGYTFPGPWPRAALEFDFATGDEDRTDGEEGGFDPLYGAAVGDLSMRGFWNLLPRRNLVLAGPRLDFDLPGDLAATVRSRGAWQHRAGGRSALAVPGARRLGVQTEVQVRWRPRGVPWFATGGYGRFDGRAGDATYLWLQGSVRLGRELPGASPRRDLSGADR